MADSLRDLFENTTSINLQDKKRIEIVEHLRSNSTFSVFRIKRRVHRRKKECNMMIMAAQPYNDLIGMLYKDIKEIQAKLINIRAGFYQENIRELSHPHIVKVLTENYWTAPDTYVNEYGYERENEGQTVGTFKVYLTESFEFIDSYPHKYQNKGAFLKYFEQLLSALTYLHEKNITHQDFCHARICIAGGVPKLAIDFLGWRWPNVKVPSKTELRKLKLRDFADTDFQSKYGRSQYYTYEEIEKCPKPADVRAFAHVLMNFYQGWTRDSYFQPRDFRNELPEKFIQLLEDMTLYKPEDRISATEALKIVKEL